jgi:PilZ domain
MSDLPPDAPERRTYPRKKTNVNALIRYGAKQTMPCTVYEISGGGARLLSPLTSMPKRFKLWLSGNGRVARNCDVVWQQGLRFGVKFDSGPKI